MAKMAELHAELTELPDSEKSYMEGFFRGRAEGLAIGQEEGEFTERERIIKLLETNLPLVFTETVAQVTVALIKVEDK